MTRSLAILLMFLVAVAMGCGGPPAAPSPPAPQAPAPAVSAPTPRISAASGTPADTLAPPAAIAAPATPVLLPTIAAKTEPIPIQSSTPAPADPSPEPKQAIPPTPAPTQAPAIPVGNRVGDRAPDFRVTTIDGRTVTPAELHGKPYILYFFASW